MTERGRTFLYHRDYPKGQIFTGDQEIEQKLREGWKEAPYPELLHEVPGQEVGKAVESPPEVEGSPKQEESLPEPLKPWQKALATRKAKKAAQQEEIKNG